MAAEDGTRHAAPGRTRRSRRQRVALAGVALLVALLLGAGAWLVSGGRWYVVASPSMGTAAPVGTLLWVRPVDPSSLRVGDLITFRPPGHSTTYSHRILAITADGIRTKGAITAPDPWTLHPSDVVGRVVARWWGVGWVVRAAPILMAGLVVGWLARRRLAGDGRTVATLAVIAATICVVLVVHRPLSGAQLLGKGVVNGVGRATYVSTGVLPIRLTAAGVRPIELAAGEHGTIIGTSRGALRVTVRPEVGWWVWALVAVFGLAPGVWSLRRREER